MRPSDARPAHAPFTNRLLAALDPADLDRLIPHLEPVSLPLGQMLYEPGTPLRAAWFPATAVASLHYVLESGASAESAGVGREGMIGISLFMGGDTTSSSAVVHMAGAAHRLEGAFLKEEFQRRGTLQSGLLRYTQLLIAQMTQTAICNRHHSIMQQISRWLLMTLDRIPSRDIVVTQEMIAALLGVRRESITEAAGRLQQAGAIRYRRGHIAVLDRDVLLASVCECYAAMRPEGQQVQLDSAAPRRSAAFSR